MVADGIFVRSDLVRPKLPSPSENTIPFCHTLLGSVLQRDIFDRLELPHKDPPNSPMNISGGVVHFGLTDKEKGYLRDFSIPPPPYRVLALLLTHGSVFERRGWMILPDVVILDMIIQLRSQHSGITLDKK